MRVFGRADAGVRAPSRERHERSEDHSFRSRPSQMPRPPARGVGGLLPNVPRLLHAPAGGLTNLPFQQSAGRAASGLGRPISHLRTGAEATAQPASARSISGPDQPRAIETSPRVRRSCLAVVPHTWLARPCAPFRGSRCIVDNKGMLAFCQGFVRTFYPLRHARACRGHPRLASSKREGVDGRDEPGHDDAAASRNDSRFSAAPLPKGYVLRRARGDRRRRGPLAFM
jgi:hypothetical protein